MPLTPGDLAPSFAAPNPSNPDYRFSGAAGRYLVMAFLRDQPVETALEPVRLNRRLFDDDHAAFFGLTSDPAAFAAAKDELPGIRWLHDVEGAVSALYELKGPCWIVLDPSLRMVFGAPLAAADEVMRAVAALPPVDAHAGVTLHAPVLIAPRIFEPAFCKRLIDHYDSVGGEPSGFMREIDGQTVIRMDPRHKKRSDVTIEDEDLRNQARARINRRLAPLIRQAFQFEPTRMERYIVACYDSAEGGYFRPHRDNTTKGTAHRKFAVSINWTPRPTPAATCASPSSGREPTGRRRAGRWSSPARCCTRRRR